MVSRSKVMAALSYLGILCFIPLLLARNDRFIHFHARQGLVIWMGGVVAMLLVPLPFGRLLFNVSSMAVLILSAIGLVAVGLGRTWRLPLVYPLSKKL